MANCQGKIRVKKNLNVFILHHYSNNDTATVSWETSTCSYRLVSCYMPYEEELVPPLMVKEVVRDSEASKCMIILGCDSNAHHTVWGSTDVNDRGECLFNYLLGTKLLLRNKGSTARFITGSDYHES